MITKWLKDTGLVVKESKSELFLFNPRDTPAARLVLKGKIIKYTPNMSSNF